MPDSTLDQIHEKRDAPRRKDDALLSAHCEAAIAEGVVVGLEVGIVKGFDAIFDDPERCKKFWRSGFDVMFEHGKNNTSQWIGSRILNWVLTAIAIGLIGWLASSGRLTK